MLHTMDDELTGTTYTVPWCSSGEAPIPAGQLEVFRHKTSQESWCTTFPYFDSDGKVHITDPEATGQKTAAG